MSSNNTVTEAANANNNAASQTNSDSKSEEQRIDYTGVQLPVAITGANLTVDNASVHCGQRWEVNTWEFVCIVGVSVPTESGQVVQAAATRADNLLIQWSPPANSSSTVASWSCETKLSGLIQRCRANSPTSADVLSIVASCTIQQGDTAKQESQTITAAQPPVNPEPNNNDPNPADVLASLSARTLLHLDARAASDAGPPNSSQTSWRNISDATNPCAISATNSSASSWAGSGSAADPYRLSFAGGRYATCNLSAARGYLVWARFTNVESGTLLSRGTTTIAVQNGSLAMRYNPLVTSSAQVTTTVSPNVWYHLAMIHEESGSAVYYLNGRQFYRLSPTSAETASGSLYLGISDAAMSASNPMSGDIAELRVFSATVSADNILSHYEASKGFYKNP